MLNVVFEYTLKAGGYAGTRTWTCYKDEAEFKRMHHEDGREKVLATGVDEEQAILMTCCTPPFSRLTTIAEEICDEKTGRAQLEMLSYRIQLAMFALQMDEVKRRENNAVAAKYEFPLPKKPAGNATEKEFILYAMAMAYDNETGEINYERLLSELEVALVKIVGNRHSK